MSCLLFINMQLYDSFFLISRIGSIALELEVREQKQSCCQQHCVKEKHNKMGS